VTLAWPVSDPAFDEVATATFVNVPHDAVEVAVEAMWTVLLCPEDSVPKLQLRALPVSEHCAAPVPPLIDQVTPGTAGIVSLRVTLFASADPVFDTVIVNPIGAGGVTVAASAVLVTDRAGAPGGAQPVSVTLAVAGVVVAPVKFTVFVNVAQVFGDCTVMATDAVPPPPAIGPGKTQVSVVVPVQIAGLAETNVKPAGSVSVTETCEAGALPLLVTVTVHTTCDPAATVWLAGVFVIVRAGAHPVTSPDDVAGLPGIV